jgi:hypothetical protein
VEVLVSYAFHHRGLIAMATVVLPINEIHHSVDFKNLQQSAVVAEEVSR